MGNLYNTDNEEYNAHTYQYYYKECLGVSDCLNGYLYRLTESKLSNEGLDYWGNRPEEKSINEIQLEQMQAQIEEWTSMQGRNNG